MNASDSDSIVRRTDFPSPTNSDGNDSTTRLLFGKANVGSMDDLNFNESLDALLDSENLNDVSSNPLQSGVMVSNNMGMRNTQAAAPIMPRMMSSATTNRRTSSQSVVAASNACPPPEQNIMYATLPPNIPYTISTVNRSSGAASMPSYTTNPYANAPITPPPRPLPPQQPVLSASVSSLTPDSSTKSPSKRKGSRTTKFKRARDATAISEDEDEQDKRRQGRNLREQQRSQKITGQIDHLREVLSSANLTFKQDKYSTLVTVADYIKELQAKSAALDAEHKVLISTISKTNEMVNDQYIPASATGKNPPGDLDLSGSNGATEDDDDTALVPNIDYRSIFASCGVALAVASVDGRFLDCNAEFLRVTGYTREELFPVGQMASVVEEVPSSSESNASAAGNKNLSLFNLLHRQHMEPVFFAMSEMLKKPPTQNANEHGSKDDMWAGNVCLGRLPDTMMRMNVSLVRSPQGRAKFFDCSLYQLPG